MPNEHFPSYIVGR